MGGYESLFLFCFIWGMGGAFISLANLALDGQNDDGRPSH